MNSLTDSPRKRYTLNDDPYYFGAYLNMARHNVFLVIESLSQKMAKPGPPGDHQIFHGPLFDILKSKQDDQKLKLIELLKREFPFLKAMEPAYLRIEVEGEAKDKMLPEQYYHLFQNLFKTLNSLRNDFSHAEDHKTDLDIQFLWQMEAIYDASIESAQSRKGYSSTDLKFLYRRIGDARLKTKVPNPDFRFHFWKDKAITDSGLAFFVCLFLEKKYANQFLSGFTGFKDNRTRGTQATLEVFTNYRIRIPKLRIESVIDKNTLFMDMLNELKRCPKDLFEHLSQEDQDKFKVQMDDDMLMDDDGAELEVLLKRHEDRFPYFALRYFDELEVFQQIRPCIDLGNFHFKAYEKQVADEDRIRRLTKKITTYGRLQDFTIAGTQNAYPGLVKDPTLVKENDLEPWIVLTQPHYHLPDENVPFKFVTDRLLPYPNVLTKVNAKSKAPIKKEYAPDFYLSQHELVPLTFFAYLSRKYDGSSVKNRAEIAIQKYLSAVKKLFTDISEGKFGAFGAFSSKQELQKAILNAYPLDQGFCITFSDIPNDLVQWLLGKTVRKTTEVADKRLTEMIDHTKRLIKKINLAYDDRNKDNKVGKKKHKEILSGKLADFIARDMMRFQPTLDTNLVEQNAKGKGKATGLTFQVLQATIAFYGATKDELPDRFKECGMLDSDNAHPFIERVLSKKCRGIVEFYTHYLEERVRYLNFCKSTEKKCEAYHWLNLNRIKSRADTSYGPKLAKKYTENHPINFPRGVFTLAIRNLLQEKEPRLIPVLNNAQALQTKNEKGQNQSVHPVFNTVFLLKAYHEHVQGDADQSFYAWPRQYKILNQFFARNQRPFDPVQVKPLTHSQIIENRPHVKQWINRLTQVDRNTREPIKVSKTASFNDFDQNEKTLRHRQAQDRLLTLLAKEMLQNASDAQVLQDNLNQLKLKEIGPNQDKGPLAQTVDYSIKLSFTEQVNGKPTSNAVTKAIRQKNLKLKNFGDLKRFVRDRRLSNLMHYYKANIIEKETINLELDQYDRSRVDIVKAVFDFEKSLIRKWPEALEFKDKENQETSKHGLLLQYAIHKLGGYTEPADRIKNIRNAFLHNQYPNFTLFSEALTDKQEGFATYFAEYAMEHYTQLTNLIKTYQ
jgi:hypothetical protein